jgi:undecaprenyl-diphosphatase
MLALGLGVFGAVAEDVLLQEHTEWILQLDGHVRAMTRPLAATPALRRAAALVSRATGPGLGAAVLVGSALLWRRGRREDAALLLGGTTGAWALAALLKLAFAVPRPSAASAVHALTAYGFPSGHVLVTTVACGLGGRVLGREVRPVVRGALLLTGLAVVGLTAAARVVLNAHWLSDVAGGAAMGLAWLATILLAVGPHPGSRVPASSS